MIYNKILLKEDFERIKKLGWIKSMRRGSTGVGYTFEKLLDIPENTLPIPDYYGIEIKTHRKKSTSNVCLFNYDPEGSFSYEIKHLYELYSYQSIKHKSQNVLNATIYCHINRKLLSNYSFSLNINYSQKKVFLYVYDSNHNLIEKDAFWSFDVLKKKLYDKLNFLAYIVADNKFINGFEFFRYESIHFYKLKDFDTFIKLLDNCKIAVSFKIGGKICSDFPWQIDNHGTSFSIKSTNLTLLYNEF